MPSGNPDAEASFPGLRPRDAATLVLYRMREGVPHVLMGKRHSGHVFMPDKYVFPGGRVDHADSRVKPACDLRPEVERHLVRACTATRARALAMAAIRETFEETGILVGRPVDRPRRSRSVSWGRFFAHGIAPDLSVLELVARAITPPGSPRRFDARFFMTDASHVHGNKDGLDGSGELVKLRWVPLEEAKTLDLPSVTSMVIGLVGRHLDEAEAEVPIPFVRWRGDENRVDYL